VIAVAASDNKDQIASFSNYGANSVHIAAPGVKIYSSVKGGKYDWFSGTSMACPHVSGVAALLLSQNPTWNYVQLKQRIIATADPVRGLRKKTVAKGRLNAFNAVNNIVPPSSEPDERLWQDQAFTLESDHPYPNSLDKTFPIHVDGAKYIRIVFEKVDMEAGYDKVLVQTPKGDLVEDISGTLTNYVTDYVEGDTVNLRITSDDSVNQYGFKVSKIQVIK